MPHAHFVWSIHQSLICNAAFIKKTIFKMQIPHLLLQVALSPYNTCVTADVNTGLMFASVKKCLDQHQSRTLRSDRDGSSENVVQSIQPVTSKWRNLQSALVSFQLIVRVSIVVLWLISVCENRNRHKLIGAEQTWVKQRRDESSQDNV